MKRPLIIAFVALICSCASMRFMNSPSNADPSIYLERSLQDVLSGNFNGDESYKQEGGSNYKYFHFISEVYISNIESQFIITVSDDFGNKVNAHRSNIVSEYSLSTNRYFDPQKKYKVQYTVRWDGILKREISIDSIDFIEGLLTYSEIANEDRKNIEDSRRKEKEQEELEKKIIIETAYQAAINTPGTESIIEYIRNYINSSTYRNYFNDESIIEIARRVTNNPGVNFQKLSSVQNPYGLQAGIIYYCEYLTVVQWIDKSIGAVIYDRGDWIFIDKVPDIRDIKKTIYCAYLFYKGTKEVTWANGGAGIVPVFDLVYHFYPYSN